MPKYAQYGDESDADFAMRQARQQDEQRRRRQEAGVPKMYQDRAGEAGGAVPEQEFYQAIRDREQRRDEENDFLSLASYIGEKEGVSTDEAKGRASYIKWQEHFGQREFDENVGDLRPPGYWKWLEDRERKPPPQSGGKNPTPDWKRMDMLKYGPEQKGWHPQQV